MNQNQSQFNAAAIGEQFKVTCNKLDNLISQNQDEKLLAIKQQFHQNLETYKKDGVLTIAFIGQYSAGKSTIISALTGNRDIKIDADIATDKTTSYDWKGSIIARKVGSNEDFEQLNKQAEFNIQKSYEQAGEEIQTVVDTVGKNIQQDFAEVLEGDLVKHFVASLERKQNISVENINNHLDLENLKVQISNLKKIDKIVGGSIQQLATKGAGNVTQQGFFYSATNVAGGNLHHAVYGVGKFLGFKFQPWGAVNLAKNIANVAKCVGPALAVAGFAVEVANTIKQREREQQMADVRRDITSQFQAIGKDLESQLGIQVGEFNNQFYGAINQKIADARKQNEEAIASSNTWMQELLTIRQEFETILKTISLASTN
ncbi:MAG: 50S ribosome-binding GTPase [Xenococcaceae cyanobacterium MO_167.B27]|nr:50S ribosome-binding GTPase [Xenococcaceae cyanobacterium MO_167.B27]